MSKSIHALNLLRFAAGSEKPITGPAKVTWEATYKCNLKCKHCHLWQVKDHNDLTTEEAKRFIADVARIGAIHLSFSGGEPFLRDDILDLMSFAHEQGLTTAANTNGTRLLTKDAARAACETGIGTLFISLDGPDPETHNALRGSDRAFDFAIKAIDNIIDQRQGETPYVFINTTVNQGNLDRLQGILKLARQHGVDGMTMSVINNVGKYTPENHTGIDRSVMSDFSKGLRELADQSDGLIPHSYEYLDNFQTYLDNPNKLYECRCVAGYSTVLIQPDGEVYACPFPFGKMGSLREKSFADVWYSDDANEIRRKIKANDHPICWFDCIAPLTIFLHNVKKLRVNKILDRKTLGHMARKVKS